MNRQYIAILAICASIILASTIIAYRPQEQVQEFRFPVGIPPAFGTVTTTGAADEQTKTISVSGAGKASARANQATLTVGVQTDDPVASVAASENAELMTAMINAIKGQGISQDKIETVSYGINPIYDQNWQKVIGYRVVNLVQVKITNLDKVGAIIDAASKAGANRIDGISFGLTDDVAEELKLDAYRNALNDAATKAEVIATTLKIKITGVLSVSESYYYPYTPIRGYEKISADKVSTPIFEGALSVSVTVHIVYTFD